MQVRVLPTGLSEQAYEMNEQRARMIRERYGRGKRYVFCKELPDGSCRCPGRGRLSNGASGGKEDRVLWSGKI